MQQINFNQIISYQQIKVKIDFLVFLVILRVMVNHMVQYITMKYNLKFSKNDYERNHE